MLTDKAKENFGYYLDQRFEDASEDESQYYLDFEHAPLDMQWGVYQDFFWENCISLEIMRDSTDTPIHAIVYVDFGENLVYENSFKTDLEAREEAIKQANRILNERL